MKSKHNHLMQLCLFCIRNPLSHAFSLPPRASAAALYRQIGLSSYSSTSLQLSRAVAAATSTSSSGTTRDAKQTQIPKHRKRKSTSATTKWIACSSTIEVTRAIEKYVREGDAVAELGSQLRESSAALCETVGPTGKVVLVDIERKFPKEKKGEDRTRAMRREGDENDFYVDRATFVETRGFEFWRESLFFREGPKPRYNVLVVDVSTVAGNDLELTCISLVKEFIALNHGDKYNECRAVIVKSGSLHNLARRLYHAQHIITGAKSLEVGYKHCGGHSAIIGSVGVKQYRDTIPFVVKKGDVCVEVGCHLGTSTILIDEAAKRCEGDDIIEESNGLSECGCLGVDVGPSIIKGAKKKYPHLNFEAGDGFKTGALARMRGEYFNSNNDNQSSESRVYDVVYVDIGGLSGSEGLLEAISLLASISNSLEPRCIVIKSLCIRRLASCLIPFSEVWRAERLED